MLLEEKQMNVISSIVLFVAILIIVIAFLIIIIKTDDKDRGCDLDCKSCPFPQCNNEEKEKKQRKLNDICDRRYPR